MYELIDREGKGLLAIVTGGAGGLGLAITGPVVRA